MSETKKQKTSLYFSQGTREQIEFLVEHFGEQITTIVCRAIELLYDRTLRVSEESETSRE